MKWSANKYAIIFGVSTAFFGVANWLFVNDDSWRHLKHIWFLVLTILLIASIAIILFHFITKEGISLKKFILLSMAYSVAFFFIFFSVMICIAWGKTGKTIASEILVDAVKLVREAKTLKANPEIFVGSNKNIFYIFDSMVIGNDSSGEIIVVVFKNIDGSRGEEKCFVFPKRYALSVCNRVASPSASQ
jgi:hypothetical protein